MAQETMKKMISQLKEMKESKHMTDQSIVDLLDKSNQHLAKNTVIKFFSEGSEDMGFQYETIRAIADVMLNVYSEEDDDNEEVRGLKLTVQLQNILIDQLKEQLKHDMEEAERTLKAEKESMERRVEFLRDRVKKQDLRIEQKDRLLTVLMLRLLRKLDPESDSEIGRTLNTTMEEINNYLNENGD